MSHPNEELLRRSYELEPDDFLQMLTEDVVVHVPGRSRISGEYRGRSGLRSFQGRLFELSNGTIKVEFHDALANDEHGASMHIATAERNGKTLHARQTWINHFRQGQISEAWLLSEDQYAVDEFWS